MLRKYASKACALAAAAALCCTLAVSAFARPSLPARADTVYPEDALADLVQAYCLDLALALIAEDAIQNPTNNFIVGALAAQAALAALYAVTDDPLETMSSGNQRYFGGYTYYNGDSSQGVYFGSGYINDDARISRLDVTTDDLLFPDSPVTLVMICKAYDSNTTPFGVYNGANRGWSGTVYIAENYWGSQGGLKYVDTTINGDYVRQNNEALPLFLGSATSNPTLSVSACGATLCSGGIPDLNSYLHTIDFTGDLETDFGLLRDDFEEEYPDIPPYVWYNFDEEPTEETSDPTEETTESSTDTVQPFTLPPEWLETYPTPSIPDPSIPAPSDAVPPTINYEIQRNGLNFWADLWTELIDKTGLGSYVVILLGLSILEWILWHAGNGGNGKGGEQ